MSRDLNIVVLGSKGSLGTDLLELLKYEKDVFSRGYSHSKCNITFKEDVYDVLGGTCGSVTNVINCAALTDVDFCEDNEELAFKVNSKSLEYLTKICLEENIHLTHISTDYVFDGYKKSPYLEQDEAIPLSVYGKSKLSGETYVRNMGNKGLVIRTSWLYGKNSKNFVNIALNKLELGTKVDAISDCISTPTYTMDLANVIIQLSLEFKSGLFHVTNSGYCSWYEFMLEVSKLLKFNNDLINPISYKDLKRKAERPEYSVLSNLKLERVLSEPVRHWKDALYQYLLETNKIYEF